MGKMDIIGPSAGNAKRTGLRIIFQQEGLFATIKAIVTRRVRSNTVYRQADPYGSGRGLARVRVAEHSPARRSARPPLHLVR